VAVAAAFEGGDAVNDAPSDHLDHPDHRDHPGRDAVDPLARRLANLAVACREAIAKTVPDATAPREVARRLGISTTSAWRFVRLANNGATPATLRSFPGPRGWEGLMSALVRAGAAPDDVAALRIAVGDLFAELNRRGLAREDLWSLVPDEVTPSDGDAIDRDRETRNNALLWGASASGMATSYLVCGDARTGSIRAIGISTFAGLRRIRPGPEWWLPTPDRVMSSDRTVLPRSPDPLPGFEPSNLLSTDARRELGRSPEGHIAFRGSHATAAEPVDLVVSASGLAAEPASGEARPHPTIFGAPIWIPATEFMLEVLFDRSLAPTDDPQVTILAQIGTDSVADVDLHHHHMPGSGSSDGLSRDERCDDLAPPFGDLSTSGRDLHARAVAGAVASLGREPGDFVRHRVVVAHPVLCTMVELEWPAM
jgi:hypothetical protein